MDTCIKESAHLSIGALVLLQLIADGIDHRQDLVKQSGLPERAVYRHVDLLLCKTHYQAGRLTGGSRGLPLVLSRKHPHQAGVQLLISTDGEQLLETVGRLLHASTAPV